jgi:REP element-mobilizing transposase RayT
MSYTKPWYHIVYATKDSAPLITDELKPELHRYLGGTVKQLHGVALEVGGVADHVHILARAQPVITLSEFVKKRKTSSSAWAKKSSRSFAWHPRFGAFTVSESQVGKARQYIQRQEEHHRRVSFEDEFKTLLQAHQIEFNNKYL